VTADAVVDGAAGGTINTASLEASTSMIGRSAICVGAASGASVATGGAGAVAASAAALWFGFASVGGLAEETAASPRGAGDAEGVGTGCMEAAPSAGACCKGTAIEGIAGSPGVAFGGASATLKRGASIRRSRQGKPKPGSPSPSPPKVTLNSSA
jgi:hypothetical protein